MELKILSEIKGVNKERIEQAIKFAKEQYAHTDGSIDFPIKVLETLLPLKPDEDSIIAVLFYDLYLFNFVNDEFIKNHFGSEVLHILSALKSLTSLNYAENDKSSQLEILRKMFFTMAKDLRVTLIWLASRLCKIKNLDKSYEIGYKIRIARETMDVYVPIASRLGLYRMKIQLEDLSFRYLKPRDYETITAQVDEFGESRKFLIGQISEAIKAFLSEKNIEAEVEGRLKNIYSIYRKLKKKGLTSVNELHDFFAIRVIIPARPNLTPEENLDTLYTVLGLIHSEWKPVSSRFKDYIAVPKPNGYRSLHTVVECLTDNGPQTVEIQIRDDFMHREAEYGVASHWLYKTALNVKSVLNSHADWLRGLEKVYEFFDEESEVLKEVELNVFKDRIFVLTPKGEVKDLPLGSIPLDFAYAIHTDVGHSCVMAKVDGITVPLDYELKNGDVIEIITKKGSVPKLQWLSLVKSGFAKQKIKAFFNTLNREQNIKEGKSLLNKKLTEIGKPALDHNYSVLKEFGGKNLNVSERESLIEEVGRGGKLVTDVIRKIYPHLRDKTFQQELFIEESLDAVIEEDKKVVLENEILVGDESGLPIKIASCCNPALGEKIMAYITRGNRITIHRAGCKLIDALDVERIVGASWKGYKKKLQKSESNEVTIKLKTVTRIGLMRDITDVITRHHLNILDVSMKKIGSLIYDKYFLLDLDDFEKTQLLMKDLEKIPGVIAVSTEKDFNS